ncbi:DUF433 domain-containing protein [Desulfonema magnum]|uniref:DUF433 n=1 Tax=Desulfonema magnum TaxID=45655 RepID=A0A975GLV2_9BACT|nr:DUF433 domain-containing protein [Desulfonema magnum]QTA86157.1 DUF433 [Desulfonema magnum]
MNIEEYFDHIAPNDIRIRGTRVGIESVLYEFIHREQPPEAIVRRFPSVTLEQVYATILYYLHNKEMIEAYLAEWLAYGQHKRAQQAENPPPVVARLRALKQKQQQALAIL